jgi:hypothetical protein
MQHRFTFVAFLKAKTLAIIASRRVSPAVSLKAGSRQLSDKALAESPASAAI